MTYKFLAHTADLRMRVSGRTVAELFGQAVRGMMAAMKTDIKTLKPNLTREVKVQAPDPTVLLVDFLNEVLTLAQTNREVYKEVNFKEFSETSLSAELQGVSVKEFDEDIKAVTYHEAQVRKNPQGEWETILIFDI